MIGILRNGLSQFLGFQVLFRMLGIAVFAPCTAWVAGRLIAWSGNAAVSNYDLAGFLLSAKGLLFVTVVATASFTLFFFEFAGLVGLSVAIARGRRIRLAQLFGFLLAALPRLWRLAWRQFATYLAMAAPCLVVAGVAYQVFLTKSDIYYYLNARPPEFYVAVAIAGAAALVFAALALRTFIGWIYSVPLLLLEARTPREALDESQQLVAGRRSQIIRLLLAVLAAVVLAGLIGSGLMAAARTLLLGLAGDHIAWVVGTISAIGVVQFIVTNGIAMLGISAFSIGVAERFLVARPEARLPEGLFEDASAVARRTHTLLGAGFTIAAMLVLATGFGAVWLLDQIHLEEDVAITAHRGSSVLAPENTMAAILLALEEGADYVEIDVQETRDGTVVLAHDKDLKRVFDIGKGIWEVRYDEIKDLDSGGWFGPDFSDQRIVTLAEAIEAVRGRARLNIELKFSGHQQQLASEVVRLVNESDFGEQCVLTSLDYAGLQRAKTAGPDLRTGVIVTSSIGDITKLDADLLSISHQAATRALIDRAHREGFEVHVWTVNDVARMNAMIRLGVDSIITDDPKLLGEVLAYRAGLLPSEKLLLELADIAAGWF